MEQVIRREHSSRDARKQEPRPYLLACDGAYAPQLATCLRSMAESNRSGWPLGCHVFVDDFPESLRKRVLDSLPAGSVTINWIAADVERFSQFATAHYISRMTFARLLMPQVMPEDTSRVVYLDADTLVLGDLSPLWDIDLAGQPVGAVIDELDNHIKANTPGFENVPRVKSYFNAGLLVVDLPQWRQHRVSEKALEYLHRSPDSPYSDQDALNVACDGSWAPLDVRWNYQGHLRGRIQDLPPEQAPAMVHFVTTLKPWKPTSLSVNAALYDSFRKRTLFARSPLQVIAEGLQSTWCRIRRFLGRFALMHALRNRVWSLMGGPTRSAQRPAG